MEVAALHVVKPHTVVASPKVYGPGNIGSGEDEGAQVQVRVRVRVAATFEGDVGTTAGCRAAIDGRQLR